MSTVIEDILKRIGGCNKQFYVWSRKPEYWEKLIEMSNQKESPSENFEGYRSYQTRKRNWLFSVCNLPREECKTFYGILSTNSWIGAMRYFAHRHLKDCINLPPSNPNCYTISLRVSSYVTGNGEKKTVSYYDLPVARHKKFPKDKVGVFSMHKPHQK